MTKAAYILVDRSGSMTGRMPAAIDNIRTFLAGLTKEGHGDTIVHLYSFDSTGPTWPQVGKGSQPGGLRLERVASGIAEGFYIPPIYPSGGTPLWDATGRVAGMALEDGAEKGSLIIFTDGGENTSQTFTAATAKAALDAVRAKGWQVEQVGIEYDVRNDAASLGTQSYDTYSASQADMAKGLVGVALAQTRGAYFSGVDGQGLNAVATTLSSGGAK